MHTGGHGIAGASVAGGCLPASHRLVFGYAISWKPRRGSGRGEEGGRAAEQGTVDFTNSIIAYPHAV